MNETIDFVTTERQHLVDLTGMLVDGIAPEFMTNAKNPVVITVRGTANDGKKVIPDAAVQRLFNIPDARLKDSFKTPSMEADRPVFTGTPEYDEYWIGNHQGNPVEVTFINADWRTGNYFRDNEINYLPARTLDRDLRNLQKAGNFLKLRAIGGLTFVHNSDLFAERFSWIDIWVEKNAGLLVGHTGYKSKEASPSLRDIFKEKAEAAAKIATKDNPSWTRFVSIDVKNETLLKSLEFQRALNRLKTHTPVFK